MIKWSWISREDHEKALIEERKWCSKLHESDLERVKKELHDKWEPVLKKAIQIKPRMDHSHDFFMLHYSLSREMVEMIAGYNSEYIWDQFAEEVAYYMKRQLLTLNFSGLYRLAQENEYRYSTGKPYA